MRALLILSITSMLAACAASQPVETQPPAGVEDRKPGAPGGPGTRGVPDKPSTGIDLTGDKPGAALADPLKDPASLLALRSIYFDFDRYEIKDEFKPVIEAHAQYLRRNGGTKMLIQGNTDERGSREYNIALGQRRAQAVKRTLQLLGVPEEQVEAVSLGEEKPKELGHTEEAWARNRRSDMLYPGEY